MLFEEKQEAGCWGFGFVADLLEFLPVGIIHIILGLDRRQRPDQYIQVD